MDQGLEPHKCFVAAAKKNNWRLHLAAVPAICKRGWRKVRVGVSCGGMATRGPSLTPPPGFLALALLLASQRFGGAPRNGTPRWMDATLAALSRRVGQLTNAGGASSADSFLGTSRAYLRISLGYSP